MNKELATSLNAYLANLGVEYIKVHNLHWNVRGSQFKAAHEYLESIYDNLSDALDEVAELLKMQGETPLASLKDFLDASSIEELASEPVGVKAALETLLADVRTLNEQARAIRELAGAQDDFHAANMMEDHIAAYEKTIWFVESMLAD